MTASERTDLETGNHWLNKLAEEFSKDAITEIDDLDAWNWTAGEVALAIMAGAQPNGVTRESKIIIRCWPWEKDKILKAAWPNKLDDFVRTALIEKAMKTPILPFKTR